MVGNFTLPEQQRDGCDVFSYTYINWILMKLAERLVQTLVIVVKNISKIA